MSGLTPTEANRLFYASRADEYDATEFCVNNPLGKRKLRNALKYALPSLGPDAKVLDAGGGSGNASAFLVEQGFAPYLVDVSPEMVAVWERKARVQGYESRCEVRPLEDFFATDRRRWDLIVFSSVLHHLEDPTGLLELAAHRLEPGGFIVTVFDPLDLRRAGVALRKLDYLVWLITHSAWELPKLVAQGVRSRVRPTTQENVGAVAEYHAVTGINDREITARLTDSGLVVVGHERTCDARYSFFRWLAELMRTPTSFSLALQAPAP